MFQKNENSKNLTRYFFKTCFQQTGNLAQFFQNLINNNWSFLSFQKKKTACIKVLNPDWAGCLQTFLVKVFQKLSKTNLTKKTACQKIYCLKRVFIVFWELSCSALVFRFVGALVFRLSKKSFCST